MLSQHTWVSMFESQLTQLTRARAKRGVNPYEKSFEEVSDTIKLSKYLTIFTRRRNHSSIWSKYSVKMENETESKLTSVHF
jgi:hypothetical protein